MKLYLLAALFMLGSISLIIQWDKSHPKPASLGPLPIPVSIQSSWPTADTIKLNDVQPVFDPQRGQDKSQLTDIPVAAPTVPLAPISMTLVGILKIKSPLAMIKVHGKEGAYQIGDSIAESDYKIVKIDPDSVDLNSPIRGPITLSLSLKKSLNSLPTQESK